MLKFHISQKTQAAGLTVWLGYKKVDQDGEPIREAGVVFSIYSPKGDLFFDNLIIEDGTDYFLDTNIGENGKITTDSNGEVTFSLPENIDAAIVEVKPPTGYAIAEGFTKVEAGGDLTVQIKNTKLSTEVSKAHEFKVIDPIKKTPVQGADYFYMPLIQMGQQQ